MMNIFKDKNRNEVYGTELDFRGCVGIKTKISYFLFKYIVIACGCVGMTEMVISSFGISIDRSSVYFPALLLLLLLPLFEYIWVRVPAYVVLVTYISGQYYNNKLILKNAVKGIVNIAYPVICTAFDFPKTDGFDIASANGSPEISMLAALCFLVLMVIVAVLVRYRAAIITAILCFLVVCICTFMGADVSVLAYIPTLVCVVGTFMLKKGRGKINIFSRKYNKKIKITNIGYELTLPLAVCIFALVFMFSGNVISNDLYKAKTQTTDFEKTMKRTVTDVASIWFSDYKDNQQAANANGGQLSFFTSLEMTDETVMRLKLVPFTKDSIFLRSYIGSLYEYNENKWEHIPEETEYTNAAQQELKESEDEGDKVEITLYGEMNKPFDSYGSVSDSIEYKSDDDFDYVVDGTRSYELEIYDKSYANDGYKAFVYDKYLQLSPENRTVIDKIVSEKNLTKENLLPELNDYFKSNFDFEYSTEVTPFGKDYVNTFLTETKTGNFVHFATAATLIYRSFGIPARYVTGYKIPYELVMSSKDDGAEATLTDRSIYPKIKNVNVTNENLYAWVEIYDDKKGWVPCDVCGDIYEELVNESNNVENENTEKNQIKEKKPKKALFKSYFETAYSSEKTEEKKASVKAFAHSALKVPAKVIALAFAAVLLLYLLYKLITMLKFAFSSNNKRAETIFKALEKKTGVNGGIRAVSEELAKFGFDEEDKKRLTEVMQKAMFSKDGASNKDIKIIIRLYKKAKTVCKKRKYCK